MESGSREGEELRRVWDKLRQEEVQAAAWLDEEVHSSFQVEVEGVGGASRDGSTRGKLMEERDSTWARMVTKGLEVHPVQARTNRPVWAWMQRDKCSSVEAWAALIERSENIPNNELDIYVEEEIGRGGWATILR